MTPPKKRAPEPEFPYPSSESLEITPLAISAAAPAYPPSVGDPDLPAEPLKRSLDRWLWPVLDRIFILYLAPPLQVLAIVLAALVIPFELSTVAALAYGVAVGLAANFFGDCIDKSDQRRLRHEAWKGRMHALLYDVHLEQKYDAHNTSDHVEDGCRCTYITDLRDTPHLVTLRPCKRVTR
jgi:hypothetical protein